MSKPIASARIPHSWHDQICAISTETDQMPSDVVKEAIGLYLEKTDPDNVNSMARRLNALEKQVRKLVQLV
ncbi:MAG: hypothetical protein AAGI45_07895 [Cyanobacteria bacterium P01_H01_bin.26]